MCLLLCCLPQAGNKTQSMLENSFLTFTFHSQKLFKVKTSSHSIICVNKEVNSYVTSLVPLFLLLIPHCFCYQTISQHFSVFLTLLVGTLHCSCGSLLLDLQIRISLDFGSCQYFSSPVWTLTSDKTILDVRSASINQVIIQFCSLISKLMYVAAKQMSQMNGRHRRKYLCWGFLARGLRQREAGFLVQLESRDRLQSSFLGSGHFGSSFLD